MIDIEGKERYSDIPTHVIINWSYPEIYDLKNQSTLEIELSHTRAADGIRIKYDAIRDGWVIEQASIFSWDADDKTDCDMDWKEVAFVRAWEREKSRSPE